MSCSYIVESQDKEKDNTLIILYKDDKTLQVDQQTLQNVICKFLQIFIVILKHLSAISNGLFTTAWNTGCLFWLIKKNIYISDLLQIETFFIEKLDV